MWSFFSRGGNDFPYVVGEEVQGTEQSIWSLHKGKHKTTEEEVSIFVFDVKGSSESQVQLAKVSFKKMKTLRHPNILPFLDGFESDKVLYVVTECVIPLQMWISEHHDNSVQVHLAISWGLHQVARGLTFLINDCNLIHNNVCIGSVLVDKSGEWKLGGLDYMYPATGPDCIPPVKILPALEKYDPPEKMVVGRRPGHTWSSDMWGLGCLIWEVFNGSLPRTNALKTINKIPKSLVPQYCELVGANPKSRPNPGQFIKDACAKGGFIDNKFVQTMLFVEEIQIKDDNEKLQFFNRLPAELDSFPQESCRYKILPQLLHAFEFGNAGSAILAPLFKLGKLLSPDEYQKKIIPCIVKLFSSTDRATRVKLLQQMEHFVEHLTPTVVNGQIFPSVMQGFMDTNPIVREHTIKSMLHLAPKLNYKNLNEELLKYFARLQVKDDQGGIRTNTTVCLGKIACYLHPQIRQKVMSSALLRAVKDPFPPARQAGILAMAATQNFFTLQESATRLLPTLCALTLDPEKTVRDQAFRAISCFLAKLQKVSEDPSLAAQMEKDVHSGGTAASGSAAAGWAGWAVSGMTSLTSKIYRGKGTPGQQTGTEKPQTPGTANESNPPSSEKAVAPTARERTPPVEPRHPPPVQEGGWDDEGWEDKNWGDMDETADTNKEGATSEDNPSAGDGWEDEDWGSLEETMDECSQDVSEAIHVKKEEYSPWGASDFAPADKGAQSASTYNWGEPTSHTSKGDFFSDMMSNPKQKKKTSELQPAPTSTTGSKQPTHHPTTVPHPSSQSAMPRQTANTPSSKPTPTSHTETRMGAAPPPPRGGWDDSGWGDEAGWGGDQWSTDDTATGASKEEIARRAREQKKAQRQKEMEQKRAARQAHGAMKLGAKKLSQF